MMWDTLYKTLKEEDDIVIPSLKNNKWNGVVYTAKLMFEKLIELFIIITWINRQLPIRVSNLNSVARHCAEWRATVWNCARLLSNCAQLLGVYRARNCAQVKSTSYSPVYFSVMYRFLITSVLEAQRKSLTGKIVNLDIFNFFILLGNIIYKSWVVKLFLKCNF